MINTLYRQPYTLRQEAFRRIASLSASSTKNREQTSTHRLYEALGGKEEAKSAAKPAPNGLPDGHTSMAKTPMV